MRGDDPHADLIRRGKPSLLGKSQSSLLIHQWHKWLAIDADMHLHAYLDEAITRMHNRLSIARFYFGFIVPMSTQVMQGQNSNFHATTFHVLPKASL